MFAQLIFDVKEKVHTAAFAAVWGSIAAISVISMFFFLCLGTFIWTSQHYDWVVASFVLGGIFLIVASASSFAFVVVRRNLNRAPPPLPAPQRAQWWLEPAVLATGLELGRTIGMRRILPVLLIGALGAGWIMSRGADHASDPTNKSQ